MAEALTDYLNDAAKITKLNPSLGQLPKVAYLHSDVDTLDRSDILDSLRKGEYDVLVGINLLREGLDLPEVRLVAILDADKEGFLRSKTSLIQTMGRAARHQDGKVIMYADKTTPSMGAAIAETNRRREIQVAYNTKHGQRPISIEKPIRLQLVKRDKTDKPVTNIDVDTLIEDTAKQVADFTPQDKIAHIKVLEKQLKVAVKKWDFESAAKLRDLINSLKP